MTGAQHQCVLSHLQYLHKNGYEKWLDVFKNTPSRKFLIVDPPMIESQTPEEAYQAGLELAHLLRSKLENNEE